MFDKKAYFKKPLVVNGRTYKERLEESINKGGTKIEDMMESPFKECNRLVNHKYSKKLI